MQLELAYSFLSTVQHPSGGWGYQVNQEPVVEPTAAVCLALQNHDESLPAWQRGKTWLQLAQNSDGGWGYNAADEQSNWKTAWAILALKGDLEASSQVAKARQWLLAVDALQFTDEELLKQGNEIAQIDFSLRGWPWLPGEASWIEPTALAMAALYQANLSQEEMDRLDEARRYLLDRRCPGGGWNVGNPVMFDAVLPARAHPTAWALMALKQLSPTDISPSDIQVLQETMVDDGGVMALAWGLIALYTLGLEEQQAHDRLSETQLEDGSWMHNPYLTALAILAYTKGRW
jgi:hypothetical protein